MKAIEKIEQEIKELKEKDYSLLDAEYAFMVGGTLGGFKSAIHKMHYTFVKQILLGILSGIIIGFGYVACLSIMKDLSSPAVQKLVIGTLFPGCIILITFLGGGLFTSHVFATIPWLKGTVSSKDYFKGIFGVLLGNFIGTFLFVLIFAGTGALSDTGKYSDFASYAYDTGLHKFYGMYNDLANNQGSKASTVFLAILFSICSGTLCNVMVSATLPLTSSTKNPVAAFFVVIFPITFFAIAGFQHGPANTFFLWIIVMVNILNPETIALHSSIIAPQVSHIFLFLFISSIPSLFGNWIGGAIILPGILHLINNKYTDVFFDKYRLEYLEKKLILIKEKDEKKSKTKNTTKSNW